MNRLLRAFTFLTLLLPMLVWAQQPPTVAVTIKPIHSLVAGVMQGVGEPTLLMPANVSPHSFSLKPSLIRQVRDADLVVWVGPSLESPFSRIIAQKAPDNKLTLLAQTQLLHHPVRREGSWQHQDHGHDAHAHEPHGQDEKRNSAEPHAQDKHDDDALYALDAHLWLNVDNAIAMTELVAQRLSALSPEYAEQYQHNAQLQVKKLETLKQQLNVQLTPVKDVPYAVFHDAYQYFEKAFNLNAVGAVMFDPARPASAKRVVKLKQSLAQQHAVCIFSEPQFDQAKVALLAKQLELQVQVLDPLGVALPQGAQQYARLMQNLADNMVDCLAQAPLPDAQTDSHSEHQH